MDSPYRSAPGVQQVQRPRDAGIVGEIVEQFADRFAFYRELIQNSIDADTESIEVSLRYDDTQKSLTVAVEDHGAGMPQDIIENGLLVLFRSTKEKDESKIGKFGIGFVSVLAVHPSVVRVISCHGGTRHTLHLYPDFSYELFDSGRTTRTGTTVELQIAMNADEVDNFVTATWDALNRWCRHATVMITLEAYGTGGQLILSERIDRPLALDGALASVERATTDESISAVVGLTKAPYSAFFNHGLLLYETHEPLVGKLSFVLQDARLGHTLSRDNVRRDDNFERALEFVRDLGKSLPSEILHQMHKTLLDTERDAYQELTRTVHRRGVLIHPEDWPLPLIDPVDSRVVTNMETFRNEGRWTAGSRSTLTAALAHAKIPVVDRRPLDETWFFEMSGGEREVHQHLTLATPVSVTDFDLVLLDMLSDVLGQVVRSPSQIILAHLEGAHGSALYVAGGHDSAFVGSSAAEPWILDNDRATRNPFRVLRRPALVLNIASKSVQVARLRSQSEPYVAAATLARLILLNCKRLSASDSELLLSHGLETLLGDPG